MSMFSLECHVNFKRSRPRCQTYNKGIVHEEVQTFDALYLVDKILLGLKGKQLNFAI